MNTRIQIGSRGTSLLKYLGIPFRLYYLDEFDENDEPYNDDRFTIMQSNGEFTKIGQFEAHYNDGCESDCRSLRIQLPRHIIEALRRNGSRTDYIELYDKSHTPFEFCDHATKEYMGTLALLCRHARLVDQVGSHLCNDRGLAWLDL